MPPIRSSAAHAAAASSGVPVALARRPDLALDHPRTRPSPAGWPRLSASVYYGDPHAAIDWLRDTLGFEVRLKVEGEKGSSHHCQLIFGDALMMGSAAPLARSRGQSTFRSPKSIDGAISQALVLFVDDVDARHALALARPRRTHRGALARGAR